MFCMITKGPQNVCEHVINTARSRMMKFWPGNTISTTLIPPPGHQFVVHFIGVMKNNNEKKLRFLAVLLTSFFKPNITTEEKSVLFDACLFALKYSGMQLISLGTKAAQTLEIEFSELFDYLKFGDQYTRVLTSVNAIMDDDNQPPT